MYKCFGQEVKDLLTDISSQHIFYLFLLKSSFDHKLVISIYRTAVSRTKGNQHEHKWHLHHDIQHGVNGRIPCSQLSQQEREEMFRLAMQPAVRETECQKKWRQHQRSERLWIWSSQFADVCEVDEGGFLGSHSDHLRGLHHELPLLSGHHVGVLLSHDVEDSVQELKQRHRRELRHLWLTDWQMVGSFRLKKVPTFPEQVVYLDINGQRSV